MLDDLRDDDVGFAQRSGDIFPRRGRSAYPPAPITSDRWHLDEMVVRIAGERMYLWRAVDHEGEVLDMLVQRRRDSRAQTGQLLALATGRAVLSAAFIAIGLSHPVPDRLGGWFELARLRLRGAPRSDQINHLAPEFRCIGSVTLRH
jgi:DDE domain